MNKIIHISPDLAYLFPNTKDTARTLCNKLVKDVLANDEFIGLKQSLNIHCDICPDCLRISNQQ